MMESRIMDELMKTAEYLKPDQLGIENRGLKAKNYLYYILSLILILFNVFVFSILV